MHLLGYRLLSPAVALNFDFDMSQYSKRIPGNRFWMTVQQVCYMLLFSRDLAVMQKGSCCVRDFHKTVLMFLAPILALQLLQTDKGTEDVKLCLQWKPGLHKQHFVRHRSFLQSVLIVLTQWAYSRQICRSQVMIAATCILQKW